jgi:tetratricopeptide (TPR) repeat protein
MTTLSSSSPFRIGLAICLALSLTACTTSPDTKDSGSGDLIKETPDPSGQGSKDISAEIDAGNAAFASRQWADAADAWGAAAGKRPSWDVHMNHAIALSLKPDFEAAIAEMGKAMNAGGDRQWQAWFNLGNIYTNRGLYAEAITAYRAGLSLHSTPHVDSLLNISAGYMFLSRYDDARATADYIVQIAPDDPRGHHNLALVLQLEERFDRALEAYEAVHRVDPNFAQSYYNKGVVLGRHLNRGRDGAAALQRYIDLDPDGPYVRRAKKTMELYRSQ